MKRKAVATEMHTDVPRQKKHHLTPWNLHLKKYATTEGTL